MHAGYDEAILLNEQGFLADGSGENVFVVQDGVLSTPPVTVVVPARHHARHGHPDRARAWATRCARRDVVRSDLYHADEVFFTGTAAEITPIRSVDDHEIGAGPITKRIQTEFFDDHDRPLGALARVPRLPRRRRPPRREGRGGAADPLSRPDIGPREEEYVLAALRSGVLGLGPYARNFEKEFAAFCGTRARRRRLERHRRAAPARARRRASARATRS